jgi:hypothetical protein
MNRAALTLVACLFALNTAVAQKPPVRVVESAGEYLLSHLDLPSSASGSLALKPCAACATQSLNVTPATEYNVNGSRLTLADFAAVVADLRQRNADERTLVGMFVDRASHNVTRIYLYKPAQ